MVANITDDIPSDTVLEEAFKIKVLDAEGASIPFQDVLNPSGKTVVIFVRHFFCGSCQDYVTKLAEISKESLDAHNVSLVIIGCSGYKAIPFYAETTGFKHKIYAEPTRALYQTLGMVEHLETTPKGQPRKSYLQVGYTMNVFRSIWRGFIKNPHLIGQTGNVSQNGGEFIFDAEKRCIWTMRMKHTEDHTEVPELLKAAGVTGD